MVSFYKEVIKDLQKKLPLDHILLKALTCLNPKQQRAHDSLQHCKVLASQMPSLQPQEEVVAGDEWIHYQELNVEEGNFKLISSGTKSLLHQMQLVKSSVCYRK